MIHSALGVAQIRQLSLSIAKKTVQQQKKVTTNKTTIWVYYCGKETKQFSVMTGITCKITSLYVAELYNNIVMATSKQWMCSAANVTSFTISWAIC